VRWHGGELTPEVRRDALGLRGVTLWFTGLPGSGKSTIASAVEAMLVQRGIPAYLLDGDNLRHGLNADLGFSAADRIENVRRVGEVARLLTDAGLVALASLISPFAEGRDAVRAIHADAGLTFLEIFVNTPPEECERRDPKGHYALARAGKMADFTGVDGTYEVPRRPDLEIHTPGLSVTAAAEQVLSLLIARGLLE
jgi:bifunctional enzyme CysN/CysC